MNAANSRRVTANAPMAKAAPMATETWSSRSPSRCASPAGEPIVKAPAGTMTISGQSGQSLNLSPAPGLRQRRSVPARATQMPSQVCARLGPIDASAITEAMAASIGAAVISHLDRAHGAALLTWLACDDAWLRQQVSQVRCFFDRTGSDRFARAGASGALPKMATIRQSGFFV